MLRLMLAALCLGLATPAAAQLMRSEGETFLGYVRDDNGGKAIPMLEQPGSRIANFKGVAGEAALHIVAEKKSLAWLGTLLQYGAEPDISDSDGNTPLIIAARGGWYEGADALLKVGANVNATNRSGETPLIQAVLRRDPRLVRLFMEKGANPDHSDYNAGLSARDYAARDRRHPELLQLIEGTKAEDDDKLQFGPVINFPGKSD